MGHAGLTTPDGAARHLGHQILRLGAPDGLSGHQDGIGSARDLRGHLSPGFPQDRVGRGSAATAPPTRRAATTATSPGAGREQHYHPLCRATAAVPVDPLDLTTAHGGSVRTVRRARPLRRRDERIERPARVRMRRRKP